MTEKLPTFEEAKSLVEGDLGIELEKYPLKFAEVAYFGTKPQAGQPASVNSGSVSLVRLKGQPVALTCSHVLEHYRKRLAAGEKLIFQVGNCVLDPLKQLRVEDKSLDYAVIDLEADQVKALSKSDGPFGGTFFVDLTAWPPGAVGVGDFVAFGGFPGDFRKAVSFDELSFGSYSSGACEVTAVGDDYLVCQFERDLWTMHGYEPEPSTLGGMSGGPVFAIRHSPASIMSYEFVGHIYEFSEDYELMYVRLARAIQL